MDSFFDRIGTGQDRVGTIEATGKERRQSRNTVLLVDDAATNRGLARGFLEGAGYQVVEAAHGHAALDAISKRPFGVIFMDLNMPYCDGPSAVHAMRTMESRMSLIPIIATTAETDPEILNTLKAMGFDDWLGIPYGQDALVEKAAHWLSVRDWGAPRKGEALPWRPSTDRPAHVTEGIDALPLLNVSHLNEMTDTMDQAERQDLVTAFRSRTSTILALMEEGWDHTSVEARQASAHAVRSSAQILGATRLAAMAFRMEFGHGQDPGTRNVFRTVLDDTRKAMDFWCMDQTPTEAANDPSPPAETLVDPRLLDDILSLPPASLNVIATHLRADMERTAGLIEQGWLDADMEAMQRGSHTLKSVAGSLGATPLETACSRLHVACRARAVSQAIALARPVYPLAIATADRLQTLLGRGLAQKSHDA